VRAKSMRTKVASRIEMDGGMPQNTTHIKIINKI